MSYKAEVSSVSPSSEQSNNESVCVQDENSSLTIRTENQEKEITSAIWSDFTFMIHFVCRLSDALHVKDI